MIYSTLKDINNVSYDILKQSKSFGVFPTPVADIVRFTELYVDSHTGLHSIPNNYISKNIDLLKGTLRKVFGAFDPRKKIIYVDPDLPAPKKNFVELHEVGHEVLPWQRKTFEFIDDHETISLPASSQNFSLKIFYFFRLATVQNLNRYFPWHLKCVTL